MHTRNIKPASAFQVQTALQKLLSSQLEEKWRRTSAPYATVPTRRARGGLSGRPCAQDTSAGKCRRWALRTLWLFLESFTDVNVLGDSGKYHAKEKTFDEE